MVRCLEWKIRRETVDTSESDSPTSADKLRRKDDGMVFRSMAYN